MKQTKLVWSLLSSLILTAVAGGYLASTGLEVRLGLDLDGGISAIYTPVFDDGTPDNADEIIDVTIENIRRRIDSLGVAEPEISRQGGDILVQLPGLDDPEAAQRVIGATAELSFRRVERQIFPGTPEYDETPPCQELEALQPEETGVVCSRDLAPALDIPEGFSFDDLGNLGPGELDLGDLDLGDLDLTEAPPEGEQESGDQDPASAEGSAEVAPALRGTRIVQFQSEASSSDAADEGTDTSEAPESDSDAESDLEDEAAETDAVDAADGEVPPAELLPIKIVVGPAEVSGQSVEDAGADGGLTGLDWDVALTLNSDAAETFAELTSDIACARDAGELADMAIVVDTVAESVNGMAQGVLCGVGIRGGTALIGVGSGASTDDDVIAADRAAAESLAIILRAGALPVTLEPSTFTEVSPTLGQDSLEAGILAGAIGLLLVAMYLIAYYRILGVVAVLALCMFGVLMITIMSLLGRVGFTLTLAGIAGVIVSIGITADSSIIFFERTRDEARAGKSIRLAVHKAFSNAFNTNLTGNTVTLCAAVVLYLLAVGPVRGFALTLGIATVLDILILGTFTRGAVGLLASRGVLTRKGLRLGSKPAPLRGKPTDRAMATSGKDAK